MLSAQLRLPGERPLLADTCRLYSTANGHLPAGPLPPRCGRTGRENWFVKAVDQGQDGALDFTGFHSKFMAPFATPRQTEHRVGSGEVMSALQCLRDAFDRMDHVLSKRPTVALVTICDSHSWRLCRCGPGTARRAEGGLG